MYKQNNQAQRHFATSFIHDELHKAIRRHGARRIKVWQKRVIARNNVSTRVEVTGHRPTKKRVYFGTMYHASRISDGYGSESGLEEIAVMHDINGRCYTTVITEGVLGYLTKEEADRVEILISALSYNGTFKKCIFGA